MRRRGEEETEEKTQQILLFLQTIGKAMDCLNDSQSICAAT